MPRHSQANEYSLHSNLLFTLSIAILCFAPLMRGGRMSIAMLILELLGILLIVVALWQPNPKQRIPRLVWVTLFTCLSLPLAYLIPLPFELWRQLPGREFYAGSITALKNIGGDPSYLAASLIPYRTISSLLAFLPMLGIVLSTLLLPKHYVIKLIYVFLGVATFQAALGLIQYGSGAEWAYWWGVKGSDATGTYPNRDHFSGLMELALPLALALTAYNFRNPQHEEETDTQHFHLNTTLIFATLSIILILALIFARSRTGIGLLMLALPLCAIIFARHVGGRKALGLGTVIGVISLGVASSIGLIPVLNRFANDPAEDVRWQNFTHTWQAIEAFFPAGSGLGTFQSVFLAYQPPELLNFVNHVHNDYLELLFEMGLAGIILITLVVLTYLSGWLALLGQRWNRFHFIQVAAGISLLLIGLHSFLDFNLHTPANSLFLAFLAGVFLHQSKLKHNYFSCKNKALRRGLYFH